MHIYAIVVRMLTRVCVEIRSCHTEAEEKCLFVISMMLCASQKGTTIRHKYFGTLDLAHDFTDKETSPYGLGFNRSSRTSERQFLFNGMVCFARAEDQK